MKECKIILGAELPESYESTKASVEDEDEGMVTEEGGNCW